MGEPNTSVPSAVVPVMLLVVLFAVWFVAQPAAADPQPSLQATLRPVPTLMPTLSAVSPPPVAVPQSAQAPEPASSQSPCANVAAYNDFVNRAMSAVDENEGSGGFVKVNWDDAGFGVSVGKFQWNQKAGGLPGLLVRFHDANPARFAEIFGEYADRLLDENFVRYQAVFAPDNDLGQRLLNALAEPSFQEVQNQIMRERIVWAINVAREHMHLSELFVVEVADIANQIGDTGMQNALAAADAAQILNEAEAIQAFVNNAPRPGGERRNAQLAEMFRDDVFVPDPSCG